MTANFFTYPRHAKVNRLGCLVLCCQVLGSFMSAPASAAPFAYISVSSPSDASVKVMDLQSMTVVRSITGVGVEPSRMVISPDFNRIYLASYLPASQGVLARGMIYAIDTTCRCVVGEVAVGLTQNRALGISPDGSKLCSWKVTSDGTTSTRNIAVLNSADLSEIAALALPQSCLQSTGDIAVHPDGRVVYSGCSEGVYILDPNTLVPTLFAQAPITNSVILGFSPDGAELYLPTLNTTVRAFNLSTAASNDFFFNLPAGSPAITGGAHRMVISKRVNSGLGAEPVFFTFFNASNAGLAIVYARRDELAPTSGPPIRRWIGATAIGPADVIGLDSASEFALSGRLSGIRKQILTSDGAVIAPVGATQVLDGVWRKSDIVFTDELLRDGFE